LPAEESYQFVVDIASSRDATDTVIDGAAEWRTKLT
jgi:hypothetical protein